MGLKVLLVDDEPLARSRLRALLAECALPPGSEVGEAANAAQAQACMAQRPWDVVLLDIHMPGLDGMGLAAVWRQQGVRPAIVFVTAHPEHALQAFEVDAVDYLTKPVRRERLLLALDKAQRMLSQRDTAAQPDYLLIHDRGRVERVPVHDVVYLKAELKYVTVRTPERSYIYDGSLHDLERSHGAMWLRVHRNALAARSRLRALERAAQGDAAVGEDAEGWWLTLDGVDERLTVSRRQLSAVRDAMSGAATA